MAFHAEVRWFNLRPRSEVRVSCPKYAKSNLAKSLQLSVNDDKDFPILSLLDKITLPEGYYLLSKYLEKGKISGFTYNITDNTNKQHSDIFEFLHVEDSIVGIWQAYLLKIAWSNLQSHHKSFCKKVITSKEDLYNIKEKYHISSKDFANKDVHLKINEYNCFYYISCCFWSESRGLERIKTEIQIHNNRIIDIKELEAEVLYDNGNSIKI